MGLAERAAARRKSKDLKNELKELRGQILAAGEGEKTKTTNDLKEFGAAMELGATLYAEYAIAKKHLEQAKTLIGIILEHMGSSTVSEIKRSLDELLEHLEGLYHDCSIREDDTDFCSTIQNLKQMVGQYSEDMVLMQSIMLRSELENVKAVLDDAARWKAPDFLALAYYYLHADRNALRDMENEQRNQMVLTYFKEEFMDELMGQIYRAGKEQEVRTLIKEYIYE